MDLEGIVVTSAAALLTISWVLLIVVIIGSIRALYRKRED